MRTIVSLESEMNIVNRGYVRALAADLVRIEKDTGKLYNPSAVADVWNTENNLVADANFEDFQKQFTLEVEAERYAYGKSIPINTVGFLTVRTKAAIGTLKPTPNITPPSNLPDPA